MRQHLRLRILGCDGSGTDVSLETADMVFMNDNLENIIKVKKLSKDLEILFYKTLFSQLVLLYYC